MGVVLVTVVGGGGSFGPLLNSGSFKFHVVLS